MSFGIYPTRPGRYLLDAKGSLHPWRRRYHVEGVAAVTIRALPKPKPLIDRTHRTLAEVDADETPQAEVSTADDARGCEGRAPEGPSGSAMGRAFQPANARQARPYVPIPMNPPKRAEKPPLFAGRKWCGICSRDVLGSSAAACRDALCPLNGRE